MNVDLRLAATTCVFVGACVPPRLAELPKQPVTNDEVNDKLPDSAPELEGDPFVRAGEYALYDLRFRGVSIAELEVLVGEPGRRDGRPVYAVRARAELSGVLEVAFKGWWEMSTELEIGGDPRPNRKAVESWSVSYAGKTSEREINLDLYDNQHSFLSAIGAIRAWAPRLGDTASMSIDLHARFELVMAAVEELEPGVFKRPSIHVLGRAGHSRFGFPFEFWISNDSDRLPLLVRAMSKWGKVELELLGFRRD